MHADASLRERVLQAILDTFVDGSQVTMTAVAIRGGLSRQRIHAAGLRQAVARFAVAQQERVYSRSDLTVSRLEALRTEVELLRHAAAPRTTSGSDPADQALVAHLRRQVNELEDEVARLQGEIIAERQAVALILRGD